MLIHKLVEGGLEGHSLGPAAPRAAYERLWARSSDPEQVARQRLGLRVEVEQELIACAAGPAAEAAYRHCRAAIVRLEGGEVDEAHMKRLLADWFAEGEADIVRERAWRLAAALVRSPPAGARRMGWVLAAERAPAEGGVDAAGASSRRAAWRGSGVGPQPWWWRRRVRRAASESRPAARHAWKAAPRLSPTARASRSRGGPLSKPSFKGATV